MSLPLQGHLAGVHAHQAEHGLEQRGLAGAVGPDDADHLAGVGDQAAAVEDVDAGQVARYDVLGLDDRVAAARRRDAGCLGGLRHADSPSRSASSAATSAAISSKRFVAEQRVVAEVGVVVRTEIGVDDGRVGHHRVGRALGDDPALGHHHDPVGDVPDDVHVVLDEEHGHALVAQGLDVAEQRLGERGVHTGHRLVEHDHRRVAHQGPRHLEELALAAGEAAGVVVLLGVQLEAVEQLDGLLLDGLLLRAPGRLEHAGEQVLAALAAGPQHHVVHHRHPVEGLGQLEGTDHPGERDRRGRGLVELAALERPVRPRLGRARLVETRDQVEERRLAGTVGPDQGGDDAALHLEVLDVHGGHAAEVADDVVDLEDRVRLGRARLGRDPGHQGAARLRVGQLAGRP